MPKKNCRTSNAQTWPLPLEAKAPTIETDHPLTRPSSWYQYRRLSDAKFDQALRIDHLEEVGELGRGHVYGNCDKRICGFGHRVSTVSSHSPFACSAFCRVAQARLEHSIIAAFSAALSGTGSQPIFVTVYDLVELISIGELPLFEPRPVRNSMRKSLRNLSDQVGGAIAAVGRIHFDLGHDLFGNVCVRPHVRLIISGAGEEQIKATLQRGFDESRSGSDVIVDTSEVQDIGALRYLLRCEADGLESELQPEQTYPRPRHGLSAKVHAAFDMFLLGVCHSELLITHGVEKTGVLTHLSKARNFEGLLIATGDRPAGSEERSGR